MISTTTVKLDPRKQLGFRLNLVLLCVLCFYLITTAYSICVLWQQAQEFKNLSNIHFERAIHAAELSRDAEQIASQALEKMIIQDYSNVYYQSLSNTPGKVFESIRSKLYANTPKEQAILNDIDNMTKPYFKTLKILDSYLLKEQNLALQQKFISKSLRNLQVAIPTGEDLAPQQQFFSNLFLKAINITVLVQNSTSHGELQRQKNNLSALMANMYYMNKLSPSQSSLLNDLQQTSEQAFSIRQRFQSQHLATLSAIRQTRQYAQRLSATSFDFYMLLKNATSKATQKHDALIRQVIINIVLFSIAFLVLTTFAYWFIQHYLIYRLHRLNSVMLKHVNGLTVPIPQTGSDEIAAMGKAFSIFVEATEVAKRTSIEARKEVENTNAKLIELNQSLQTLSHTDDLTQISNRRHFFQYLTSYWEKAILGNYDVSLIMIDLDWFKLFNDRYGHQAGDKCLFQVSQIFKDEVDHAKGMVARYGGEEFIVLLPNTNQYDALVFANQLSKKVKETNIIHEGSQKGRVTLSLGIASHNPKKGDDLDKLIQLADQALYQAKHNGRDQVSESVIILGSPPELS